MHKMYQIAYCLLSFLGIGLNKKTAILFLDPTAFLPEMEMQHYSVVLWSCSKQIKHRSMHCFALILVTLSDGICDDTPQQTNECSTAHSIKGNIHQQ